MPERIYLIASDQSLTPMETVPYDDEDLLQRLLAKYPDLLAGEQMGVGELPRWLLVRREMDVPDAKDASGRWSLDHLFLDQEGTPTLVETKRSSDTRLRREVVGQMLDYAANAVAYWPIEQIQIEFAQTCQKDNRDPDAFLDAFLRGESTREQFWSRVKTNLQAGKIRMVFVADVLPPELSRIIEFLNQQMDPAEVLGVELRQFLGNNLRTIVPRVVGQTSEAEQKKRASAGGPQATSEYWLEFLRTLAGSGLQLKLAGQPTTMIVRFHTESKDVRLYAQAFSRGERYLLAGLDITASPEAYERAFNSKTGSLGGPTNDGLQMYREGRHLYLVREKDCDPSDRASWAEQHNWIIDQFRNMLTDLLPTVLAIQPDQ